MHHITCTYVALLSVPACTSCTTHHLITKTLAVIMLVRQNLLSVSRLPRHAVEPETKRPSYHGNNKLA